MTATMTADGLLELFADAGYRTHRTPHARWYEPWPRVLLSLPSHDFVEPPEEETDALLRRVPAVALRHVTPAGRQGKPSFQMVADGRDYGLARLSGSNRSKVQRGLKRFEIRTITGQELTSAGEVAFRETLARQRRLARHSVAQWRRFVAAAERRAGIEFWGAWRGEQLAAYMITFLVDDVCELYQGRSRNEFLRDYPNNGLVFTIVEEMLARRGFRQVTYGLEALEPVEGVDAFKLGLGFERRPAAQRVVFHPFLRAVLGSTLARATIERLARRRATTFWRKAHGLLAFGAGVPVQPAAEGLPAHGAAVPVQPGVGGSPRTARGLE
jgi:hypothetical protein